MSISAAHNGVVGQWHHHAGNAWPLSAGQFPSDAMVHAGPSQQQFQTPTRPMGLRPGNMTARSPDTLTRSMAELTAEGSPEKRRRVSQQEGSSSPPQPSASTPVTPSQQPMSSGQPATPNTGPTKETFVSLSAKQWRELTGNWATLHLLLELTPQELREGKLGRLPVGLYEHQLPGIVARIRAYLKLPFPLRVLVESLNVAHFASEDMFDELLEKPPAQLDRHLFPGTVSHAARQAVQGMIDTKWLYWDDDLGMYCTPPGPPPAGSARHLHARLTEDKGVQLLPEVLMDPKLLKRSTFLSRHPVLGSHDRLLRVKAPQKVEVMQKVLQQGLVVCGREYRLLCCKRESKKTLLYSYATRSLAPGDHLSPEGVPRHRTIQPILQPRLSVTLSLHRAPVTPGPVDNGHHQLCTTSQPVSQQQQQASLAMQPSCHQPQWQQSLSQGQQQQQQQQHCHQQGHGIYPQPLSLPWQTPGHSPQPPPQSQAQPGTPMHQPVQGNTTALIHSQAGQLGTFVDLTIPLVWKVLGDVAGISLPGKLGARLELVVASNTFPHPTVRAAHVFYIDDLHCPVSGQLQTDGAGLISWDLATATPRVQQGQELKKDEASGPRGAPRPAPAAQLPPIMQVRISDARRPSPIISKGVLVPCKALPPGTIIVPFSMVKAPADMKDLVTGPDFIIDQERTHALTTLCAPAAGGKQIPVYTVRPDTPALRHYWGGAAPAAVQAAWAAAGVTDPVAHAQSAEVLGIVRSYIKSSLADTNRQLLLLLDRGGVPREPFIMAMRECSRQAGLLSTDRDVARGLAKQLGHEDTFKLLEAGIGMEAVNNPKALVFRPDQHLQQQLHQLGKAYSDALRKLHLPLMESWSLVGVPDWSGAVPEGCIALVLEGRPVFDQREVLLYRHPGLSPSSVQKVRVVVPAGDTFAPPLPDAVYFSVHGPCISALLAGGDYDGDEYVVVAEPLIVSAFAPWKRATRPSAPPVQEQQPGPSSMVDEGAMIRFLSEGERIQKQIGAAATLWNKWADAVGAEHESCQKLAEIYDKALDAVKKGGVCPIPKELRAGPATRAARRPITAELDEIIKEAVDALEAPHKTDASQVWLDRQLAPARHDNDPGMWQRVECFKRLVATHWSKPFAACLKEEEEVLRSLSDDAHREDAEEQSLQRKSGVQRMALRVLRSRILGIDTYNDSDDDSDDDSDNTTEHELQAEALYRAVYERANPQLYAGTSAAPGVSGHTAGGSYSPALTCAWVVAGDILRHKKARKLARFKDKQALLGRVTYV